MTPSPRDSSGPQSRRPAPGADNGVAVADRRHWADRNTQSRASGRPIPFRRPPAAASRSATEPAPSAAGDVEMRVRHWTTLGTATRRPRTSDRPEVVTPVIATAAVPGGSQAVRGSGPAVPGGGETVGGAAVPGGAGKGGAGSGGVVTGGVVRPGVDMLANRSAMRDSGGARTDTGVLGGPLRDIRPHRAKSTRRGRRGPGTSRRRLGPVLVLTMSVLTVTAGAVAVFAGKPGGLGAVLKSAVTDVPGDTGDRTVSAPLDGRRTATFELGGVASLVTVRIDDLGTDLYRISTGEDTDARPSAAVDGDTVRLSPNAGTGAPAGVEVLLSAKAVWTLRLTGGAQEHRLDLSRGQVAGVELAGGARAVDLDLPAAPGAAAVSVTGAVEQLAIRSPQNVPVRLKLAAGARTVSAGQRTMRDVPAGATFTPREWEKSGRYDVTLTGRATLVSVRTGD